MEHLPKKQLFSVGLMLFSLFFGAGNLIFPPALGQAAGSHLWTGLLGFLLTAVGLPLLGVASIAVSGNLDTLTRRVHPVFAIVFPAAIYLSIGPLLAIPRAASVAFEMGAAPFLSDTLKTSSLPLFLYSVLFFALVFTVSLNPGKLVDLFGKLLTPTLLILIAVIFVGSLIKPLGSFGIPVNEYQSSPLFKGFMEGYLTMDALASLAYGIVIISALEARGVREPKKLALTTIKAGGIAGLCLALIYLVLAYMGASSHDLAAGAKNGGQILTVIVIHLFGQPGAILLGVIFTMACFATSTGLVTSCSQYFNKIVPAIPYKGWITILCLFSMTVTNLGLTQIISVSVPILNAIYPLAIVLILLSFLHKRFNGYSSVYIGSLVGTAVVSIVDSLKEIVPLDAVTSVFKAILPLYSQGIGWLLSAIIGGLIGYLVGMIKAKNRA